MTDQLDKKKKPKGWSALWRAHSLGSERSKKKRTPGTVWRRSKAGTEIIKEQPAASVKDLITNMKEKNWQHETENTYSRWAQNHILKKQQSNYETMYSDLKKTKLNPPFFTLQPKRSTFILCDQSKIEEQQHIWCCHT